VNLKENKFYPMEFYGCINEIKINSYFRNICDNSFGGQCMILTPGSMVRSGASEFIHGEEYFHTFQLYTLN